MNPSSTFTRLTLLAAVLGTLVGCELSKLGRQAAAPTVAVSTLLTTPAIVVTGDAVAFNGLDASIPSFDAGDFDASVFFDGGNPFADAGISFGDGGLSVTIPAQNLAFVFFGKRQGDNLDSPPVGTPGATATLKQVGGPSFSLGDQGGGAYVLSPDAGFVYQPEATYQFEFGFEGVTYVAEVENVPRSENIPEFHPPAGYVELNAGDTFVFHRPDPPPGQLRNFGFVNVIPVNIRGEQGSVTYTNLPTTALGFLKLVVAPSDWQKTRVEIPATAFPDKDANYLIVLQSAKLGGPKTENLFAGSAILAGTADVAIVKTRK